MLLLALLPKNNKRKKAKSHISGNKLGTEGIVRVMARKRKLIKKLLECKKKEIGRQKEMRMGKKEKLKNKKPEPTRMKEVIVSKKETRLKWSTLRLQATFSFSLLIFFTN